VQVPDGTATPAEANDRRVEKPAPEHVEAENKTDTVHPLPHQVAGIEGPQRGPGRRRGERRAGRPRQLHRHDGPRSPRGDLPDHEPGTFLHGQTKEQVEATKRYSEPHELPKDVVYVTTPDGVKTHKGAARTRPTSTGGVEILAPAVTGTEPKVLKTYRAGEWSYAGNDPAAVMGDWSQAPEDFVAPLYVPTEGLKMPQAQLLHPMPGGQCSATVMGDWSHPRTTSSPPCTCRRRAWMPLKLTHWRQEAQ
jgi:hypothetical protein